MAHYAIGDVQGCYIPLQALLEKIQFRPQKDSLWFAGDLVNRGPDSLAVLRFVKSLGDRATVVLGNHDLHCLAVAFAGEPPAPEDTLAPLLMAKDSQVLLHWLRQQKLFHVDNDLGFAMVHAGIPPQWHVSEAKKYAREVEALLAGERYRHLLRHLYGDQPDHWDERLQGFDRWRLIVNYLTRMRFCDSQGRLDLQNKMSPEHAPAGMAPWFTVPKRKAASMPIIFGHWAALRGKANGHNVFALDTGCVWGGQLTALRLEDRQRFSVDNH